MNYTEAELSDLIKSVEAEFSAHLTLAKSEDAPEKEESKEEPKKDESPKEETKEEPTEDQGDEGQEAAPAAVEGEDEAEEQVNADDAGEDAPPSVDAETGDEGHDYDSEDLQHLEQMYASMSKGELKVHHDAIKACLDAQKGDVAAAAPAPEAPAEEAAPEEGMTKSEIVLDIPVVNEEVALLKSELGAKAAEAEELKKSLDLVTELLTKMVKKAPAAKAVTELQVINKSEVTANEKTLSKSEVTAKLSAAAQRPDLTKSDRDAINAFYLNNTNIESISHLLK